MFAVVGNQRTGTNLLREILNTNDDVAMLGEILTPSSAPAHWENFVRELPGQDPRLANAPELEALLDRYFEFVRYRIRHHWERNLKHRSRAVGVDIKYNQLGSIQPSDRRDGAVPFLVRYLISRGFTFVHAIRRNAIESAVSASVATQRGLWHNYGGAAIDRSYRIDAAACLAHARTIVAQRVAFAEWTEGSRVVASYYDDLLRDVARAGPDGTIPPGPGALREIARALDVLYQFRYDGRLQRAIDVPYPQLISNFDELLGALESSEFCALVATLHG
jgi:LPS sulfotransferase NodH